MQMLLLGGATWCAASLPLCLLTARLLHRAIDTAERREALRLLDAVSWAS